IEFPTVTNEDGEEVQLSHGLYGQLLESKNRDVRQEAFEALYEVYGGLKNTFASTFQTNVKKNNYLASTHKYKSARHRALSNNHIPEEVHDTLIEVVNNNLHLLHRYMELRKKLLDVDELNMYDLYVSMVGERSEEHTSELQSRFDLHSLPTRRSSDLYLASTHKYKSARHRALSNNHIPEEVHDTLIEVVNNNLHLLHRYMELRKKLLDVDELNMYDLYVSMVGESGLKYDYEEATATTF